MTPRKPYIFKRYRQKMKYNGTPSPQREMIPNAPPHLEDSHVYWLASEDARGAWFEPATSKDIQHRVIHKSEL